MSPRSLLALAALVTAGCAAHTPPATPVPSTGDVVAATPGADRDARFRSAIAKPAEVGMDAVALARVDSIIAASIGNRASPGVALAVGRHGRIVKLQGYGKTADDADAPAVTDSTMYDLASLTKVVGTTTAFAWMVGRGKLSLDEPVQKYVPEWQGSPAKEAVTLRNLVLHNSGLPAFKPFYRDAVGRDEYRRRIGAIDLEYEPGAKTVYSDFGIILLGLIIEKVDGRPLDRLLQEEFWGPLGLRDTRYLPNFAAQRQRPTDPALLRRIAPTEVDTIYRHVRVHGSVHDENADALGGVSGHAGLFSSARDLAVFGQLLLNYGRFNGRRYLDSATVALFTQRQGEGSSRAIGWDTPTANSSAGDYFSARSFGHTGFTGTSIWMDPERDVFVVLLTNRVYYGRENQRQNALRRNVADAVQLSIRDTPVSLREAGKRE